MTQEILQAATLGRSLHRLGFITDPSTSIPMMSKKKTKATSNKTAPRSSLIIETHLPSREHGDLHSSPFDWLKTRRPTQAVAGHEPTQPR